MPSILIAIAKMADWPYSIKTLKLSLKFGFKTSVVIGSSFLIHLQTILGLWLCIWVFLTGSIRIPMLGLIHRLCNGLGFWSPTG